MASWTKFKYIMKDKVAGTTLGVGLLKAFLWWIGLVFFGGFVELLILTNQLSGFASVHSPDFYQGVFLAIMTLLFMGVSQILTSWRKSYIRKNIKYLDEFYDERDKLKLSKR